MTIEAQEIAQKIEKSIKHDNNLAFEEAYNALSQWSDGRHQKQLAALNDKLHRDGFIPGLEIVGIDRDDHHLVARDAQGHRIEIDDDGRTFFNNSEGATVQGQYKKGDGHSPVKVTYDGWSNGGAVEPFNAEVTWPNGDNIKIKRTSDEKNEYEIQYPDGSINKVKGVIMRPETGDILYQNKYGGITKISDGTMVESDRERRPFHIRDAGGRDTFISYDKDGKAKVIQSETEDGKEIKLARSEEDPNQYDVFIDGALQKKDFRPWGLTGFNIEGSGTVPSGAGGGGGFGLQWENGDYKKVVQDLQVWEGGGIAWYDPEMKKYVVSRPNGSIELRTSSGEPYMTSTLQEIRKRRNRQ